MKVKSYRSKISFQYGFKVFLITDVVWVCSPPTVATANGSGNPVDHVSWQEHPPGNSENGSQDVRNTSRLYNPSAAITVV